MITLALNLLGNESSKHTGRPIMVAIDSLQPRNHRLRDVGEKSGSIALAAVLLVSLLFLLVLVWQLLHHSG